VSVQAQVAKYVADQGPAKREEMQALHQLVLTISPNCRLWFLDGRNEEGKIVSNPNIGYGSQTQTYANGKTREFYRIGLSANTSGLSVYFMGVTDKKHLSEAYGPKLGKANITGYCVKFRTLKDINIDVLEDMITDHMGVGPGA
jgi:hypothetical protein